MPQDEASGHARIRRDGFVSGIARHNSLVRTAHYARYYQHGRHVAILAREFPKADRIVIHDRSRRTAVDESGAAKTLISERAGKSRRPGRDDFGYAHCGALEFVHELQQATVAGMRRGSALPLVKTAVLPVVVMKAAEI